MVTIRVEGPYGAERLDALVDTGFDGFLSLPQSVIFRLGLKRAGSILVQSANGSVSSGDSYVASVGWLAGPRQCISIVSSIEMTSIGTRLLDGSLVELDFRSARKVEIR
jgi:clan AA aspartic protease